MKRPRFSLPRRHHEPRVAAANNNDINRMIIHCVVRRLKSRWPLRRSRRRLYYYYFLIRCASLYYCATYCDRCYAYASSGTTTSAFLSARYIPSAIFKDKRPHTASSSSRAAAMRVQATQRFPVQQRPSVEKVKDRMVLVESRQSHNVNASSNANACQQNVTAEAANPLLLSHQGDQGYTRRSLVKHIWLAASVTAAATAESQIASAGIPEVDTNGNLFSPKSDMLSGGSKAARGIATRQRGTRQKPGQAVQTVYETRFIAYLSRFLLTFDPAANAWWLQNGFRETWEMDFTDENNAAPTIRSTAVPEKASDDLDSNNLANIKFAEFAESVEVGLADYFTGPYGSYSSVSAAKAGLLASSPALSSQPSTKKNLGVLSDMFSGRSAISSFAKRKKNMQSGENKSPEKNGVLNLYSLLKTRYRSVAAKRQLAILFSFISSPSLQPTREIKGLLGEADNACVSNVDLMRPIIRNEEKSRTSSRRGGGFSKDSPPEIVIEAPPPLGDDYRPSEARPIMKPTSRVLRIQILDPGTGYAVPPQVSVLQNGCKRVCQACATIDRRGRVSEIIVLDPGYGYGDYGGKHEVPPIVRIAPPTETQGRKKEKVTRQAVAAAHLEYEVADIEIVTGGNGYVKTEPPTVSIPLPPEDPDWFFAAQEQPEMRMIPVSEFQPLRAEISEMKTTDGSAVFSFQDVPVTPAINSALIQRLRRDPLELLPSSVMLEIENIDEPCYRVASLPPIPPNVRIPSPRYRAFDPIFGGVGSVPVTKGALALSASEYGRLALSGAVCTVIVRTALNPLELIKTKQQLENDEELSEYARKRVLRRAARAENDHLPIPSEAVLQVEAGVQNIGITDYIISLAELRGPLALFQSADITFLASLVFGSFGFGATELFRRSFTEIFFSDAGGGGGGAEVILLLAAAVATVVTSAAATPLEVLRVKSMIRLEPAGWVSVLQSFIEENPRTNNSSIQSNTRSAGDEFRLADLDPRDLLPLWSGFAPTCSRELSFAIPKFLAFDILARTFIDLINSQTHESAIPVQVGVGPAGLAVSAIAGAIAGVGAAIVSHPADLILTYTSASASRSAKAHDATGGALNDSPTVPPGWVAVVKDLLSRDGGVSNLFLGLPARATFFFLVIGLQFFLYDYVKNLFRVGTDDLSLVLDVFYAVRAGLLDID